MSNTQLPAEWVDKLNAEALEKYPVQLHRVQNGLPTDLKEYERQLWLTGATEYAILLHQAQQEILLNKTALELVAEKYVAARALLEKVVTSHEAGLLPDRFIFEEIKTFLDGKK